MAAPENGEANLAEILQHLRQPGQARVEPDHFGRQFRQSQKGGEDKGYGRKGKGGAANLPSSTSACQN